MELVKDEINLSKLLTIIIPVHQLDDETGELLKIALNSVAKQHEDVQVLVIHPDNAVLDDKILDILASSELETKNIRKEINSGETDFCSQVNFGVSQVETEYFSILELDDQYYETYFKNLKEYLQAYPKVSCYIPTTVIVQDKTNTAIALVNQDVWAYQFSEKQGFLDIGSLLVYNNFMISGAIIKKEAFEEVGGLKPDIKLYFAYEFLLRFINNDFSTMVIPKIGYQHLWERKDSLFDQYKDEVTGIKPDEAKFYLESAKTEYFFNPKDFVGRKITYQAPELK